MFSMWKFFVIIYIINWVNFEINIQIVHVCILKYSIDINKNSFKLIKFTRRFYLS